MVPENVHERSNIPKKPPDLIKGPDSGVGLEFETGKLAAVVGLWLEPVEGVGGKLVIAGSDLVLPSGTGRVIGAAK